MKKMWWKNILVFFATVVVMLIASAISAQQILSGVEERVRNTLLIWSDPLGEKIIQGQGKESFKPLLKWIKDNEVLIEDVNVDLPGSAVSAGAFKIPFMFHGAELYSVGFTVSSGELISQVILSPLFLGVLLVTLLSVFSYLIIQTRHLYQEQVLRAELQWQDEKIRWSKQVAHDLRQPLSCLKIVSDSISSQRASEEDLQLLSQTVERIEKTAQDLLQIKKPEAPQLGATSLREVVLEIVEEFRKTNPKLEWSLSGDLFHSSQRKKMDLVPLKKTKLQRVISNVLSNAVDVSKAGQTIYIGVSCVEDMVIFECVDEGPGFDEEILQQIGKTEITGKAHGNGLGLFDLSMLMNHLGGELHIESQKDIGSRVQLSFPSIQR